ncbi:hypothetical protein Tco_0991292 [Tanacetum coccineum]|uniref:Uncharacterized protein n=1 Tax=Tanacetum coccineum TaxID=301880 RepID=A0ABQ5EZM3_9ASTR
MGEKKKLIGTLVVVKTWPFMTAPSSSSTNDANTACSQVSAASPSVNTASHTDLEKIHKDDLEAMGLKWQISLLSVRAKKYYQRIGKKIFINEHQEARKTQKNKLDKHGLAFSDQRAMGPPNTSKSVSEVEPKKVRKNDGAPIIDDWVSDDEEQDESKPKSKKKFVIPTANKIKFAKPENHGKTNSKSKLVLLKTSLTPVNTVRLVNTAHPKTTVHSAKNPKTHFQKQAQSTAKEDLFICKTTLIRRSVHEAKRHYYTGRHYAVNTARSYSGQVNAVRVKGVICGKVKAGILGLSLPTKSNGESLAFKRHRNLQASRNLMIKGFLIVMAQAHDG